MEGSTLLIWPHRWPGLYGGFLFIYRSQSRWFAHIGILNLVDDCFRFIAHYVAAVFQGFKVQNNGKDFTSSHCWVGHWFPSFISLLHHEIKVQALQISTILRWNVWVFKSVCIIGNIESQSKQFGLSCYVDLVRTIKIRRHFRTRPLPYSLTLSSRISDTFTLDPQDMDIMVKLRPALFLIIIS